VLSRILGSRTEENLLPVLSFGRVFLPPCGMGEEKKLTCRLGDWKINLDEGEKEMYVQVRIRYSSIEEGLHGGRECE